MTNLYDFQFNLVTAITAITYTLYIVIALGISASAPMYLKDLVYYTKIYVSLFLIVRFNPFRSVKFTPLDAKIAFNAGMFLLFALLPHKSFSFNHFVTGFPSGVLTESFVTSH